MKLDELLSRPLPYEITENNDTMFRAKFKAGERVIEFFGENDQGDLDEDEGEWDIGFGERVKRTFGDITYDLLTFELTKSGEEFSVFATLKALIEKLVKEKNPKRLRFTADKRDGNRARLYQKMFQKNLPSGWKINRDEGAKHEGTLFTVIKEALDKPLPYEVTLRSNKYWQAEFKVGNRLIQFEAERIGGGWDIIFGEMEQREGGYSDGMKTKKTGKGNEFQIFATVKAILDKFIEEKNPIMLSLDSHKGEPSRAKLYQRMIAKNLPSGSYYYTLKTGNSSSTKRMVLVK